MKRRLNYLKRQKKVSFIIPFPFIGILTMGFITFVTIHKEPHWTYNWTGIRKNIKDSLIAMDKRRVIPIGLDDIEVIRKKWVMRNATEVELLKLTESPSTTIKTIAYEGLLRKTNFNQKDKLIIEAIKDTTCILFLDSPCSSFDISIGEYFVNYTLGIDTNTPVPPVNNNFGLSKLEKENIITEYRKIYKY